MCKACEKNTVYEFTNKRKLCKGCYIKYFQKKFLYTIRKFKMIKIDDVVYYKKSNDFRSVVLGGLLKVLVDKGVISIGNKSNKIALTDTLDSESDKIIHELIKGDVSKLKNSSAVNGKFIKPLYLFLDKEIELYARLRGLKFSVKKAKKDKISMFIEDMEKNHPELKRAIINSYLELY